MTEATTPSEVVTKESPREISPGQFKKEVGALTTQQVRARLEAHHLTEPGSQDIRAQGEFPVVPTEPNQELIEQANQQRNEILVYEQDREVEELERVCEVVGIPFTPEMANAVRQTMAESDAPFAEIVNKPPGETVEFPAEMRQDALNFSANYDATNILTTAIVEGNLRTVNERDYIPNEADKETIVITETDSVPSGDYERVKEVKGNSWGADVSTGYGERGEVIDKDGTISDIMVAKNMVALAAAKQMLELGGHLNLAEEEVRKLFFLETIGDYKELMSLVKTGCEVLQGQAESALEPGLPKFSELPEAQKQLLVTAIFAAHGGWKAGVEDRAQIEALRAVAATAKSPEAQSKSADGIIASWVSKRMTNENAFSYFGDMLNHKGWPEVAKDVFQVAQGLIMVKIKQTEASSTEAAA
jgi:hypothetical protein